MKFTISEIESHSEKTVEKTKTVTAKYYFVKDGINEVTEVPIKYWDLTVKESRELQSRIKGRKNSDEELKDIFDATVRGSIEFAEFKRRVESAGETVFLSDMLLPMVAQLPFVVDEDDNPVKITLEVLDSFSVKNLSSFLDAIQEDKSPK